MMFLFCSITRMALQSVTVLLQLIYIAPKTTLTPTYSWQLANSVMSGYTTIWQANFSCKGKTTCCMWRKEKPKVSRRKQPQDQAGHSHWFNCCFLVKVIFSIFQVLLCTSFKLSDKNCHLKLPDMLQGEPFSFCCSQKRSYNAKVLNWFEHCNFNWQQTQDDQQHHMLSNRFRCTINLCQ